MIILTQLSREFNLTFSLLVPPSIMGILAIIIIIFIPIPTLTVVLTLLFIPSGLLVTLLVQRLYQKHTHYLGGLTRSRGLS